MGAELVTQTNELQAAVLAWVEAEPGRGYKRAAKEFGLPPSTVRGWLAARRGGTALPRPNARTTERGEGGRNTRDREQDDVSVALTGPEAEPDWDPTSCTRAEYLEAGILRCLRMARAAAGNGVARQWELTASRHRQELDELRTDERRSEEAAGRLSEPDPAQLAARVFRAVVRLARVLPRHQAVEIHAKLGQVLGLVDEPDEPGAPA